MSSIAATLTTAAFVPQTYKIIRSRETAGVSLLMHVAFAAGVAFCFALDVMLWNWLMMIANALTFVLTDIIVMMKLYTDKARAKTPASRMWNLMLAAKLIKEKRGNHRGLASPHHCLNRHRRGELRSHAWSDVAFRRV